MSRLAIVNIGSLVSGDLEKGLLDADSVMCEDGVIVQIGRGLNASNVDVIVDAQGTTVMPGLIDSHCHVVLGDYTPRQKTVDFLDSYVHGGITTVVSPGATHTPGRPHDPVAAKALAIAYSKCFENFRPNGMKIHAGTVLLEPGLTEADFAEMGRHGVRYAKYGFGGYADPRDGEQDIRNAQKHGLCVMAHSGGTSIPGSTHIDYDILLYLRPDVCGHINGGFTSLDDEGVARLVRESDMVLQIVQAGNLRAALHIIELAYQQKALARICLGSDTPSGTGVMPMGIIKSICELASLGKFRPEETIAFATGNNARIFGLKTGTIALNMPADLIICDAPVGSPAHNALEAIARGDIPGISCVIIDAQVKISKSRNTPLANRLATVKGVGI
jgi:enamidase